MDGAGQASRRGTFSVSIATYHALLPDLCEAIVSAGFKKILIVNSHGGNSAALTALNTDLGRELEAPIATTSVYALPHKHGAFAPVLEDQKGVRHACEAETSMMMAAFPDCVRKDKPAKAYGSKDTMATPSLGCMATPHSGVATRWGWCGRHHWGVGHLSVERFGQVQRSPST